MKVLDFTAWELQKMRFVVKKTDQLAQFFEGDVDENKLSISNLTVPPVLYVSQSITTSQLISLVLQHGYNHLAGLFGVSVSYLKSQVSKRTNPGEEFYFEESILKPVSEEDLPLYAARIPYMTILEAVTGWSASKIKKLVKTSRLFSDSNLTMAKGRKAELVFKDLAGSHIIKDMNEEDKAQCPYDFLHDSLGKVDVKSSRTFPTKTKGDRWYFNLKRNKDGDWDCDHFVLIGFDRTYEKALWMRLVNPEDVKDSSFVQGYLDQVDMRFQ